MRFEIVLAPEAVEDVHRLKVYDRSMVREAIEKHLRHVPTHASKSRIKRLSGLSQPQFRLRVGELRVFYDVEASRVNILAVVRKPEAAAWLKREGAVG